jgi:hypothetical protein
MESDLKKGIILLKTLIFHYHGMDEDERKILDDYVSELDAKEEYNWAIDFVSKDYLSAFERTREFLKRCFFKLSDKEKLQQLLETWEDNHKKGYVTEMETTALINISRDLEIEDLFVSEINKV